MEQVKLSRKDLYDKLWSTPIDELCNQYDLTPRALEDICYRLNIPTPEKVHWKKIREGKKSNPELLPDRSKGTESVLLYKRDDEGFKKTHDNLCRTVLSKIDPSQNSLSEFPLDKLIGSTREGLGKDWEPQAKYWEKSLMLDIRVAPENLPRAVLFMDVLIKALRLKGHQLVLDKHDMFALVDGEKIGFSLRERNKKVQYENEFKRFQTDTHPAGVLYLKKEGRSYESKEWKGGPKKGELEHQIPDIIEDFALIARGEKESRERMERSRQEREVLEKLEREQRERQDSELARFRGLLLDAHRFSLAKQVREYVNSVEAEAITTNIMTEETKKWIEWARKRADWYDPSMPNQGEDLLDGIDIENLRSGSIYYSGFGLYEDRQNNFWKPWWSRP